MLLIITIDYEKKIMTQIMIWIGSYVCSCHVVIYLLRGMAMRDVLVSTSKQCLKAAEDN